LLALLIPPYLNRVADHKNGLHLILTKIPLIMQKVGHIYIFWTEVICICIPFLGFALLYAMTIRLFKIFLQSATYLCPVPLALDLSYLMLFLLIQFAKFLVSN
jgi:hypothetical protein